MRVIQILTKAHTECEYLNIFHTDCKSLEKKIFKKKTKNKNKQEINKSNCSL